MPRDTIVHIKQIDIVKGDLERANREIGSLIQDIKLMKLTLDELKLDIKKINIKLKARESIDNDNEVSPTGGWWYWG